MPGGSISYDPVAMQKFLDEGKNAPAGSQPGTSSSGPAYPDYASQAGTAITDLVSSAKQSAVDQKTRLMDFIKNLYSMRNYQMMQAKGAASRGAQGQQNPLAVYQAVNEMANQAGIPLQANISQALMQGNAIENTLNDILSRAVQSYTQLASIPQSRSTGGSSGGGGGGGSVMKFGGDSNSKGGKTSSGGYTDIRGNKSATRPPSQSLDDWINQENARKSGIQPQTPTGPGYAPGFPDYDGGDFGQLFGGSGASYLQPGESQYGQGYYTPEEIGAYDGGGYGQDTSGSDSGGYYNPWDQQIGQGWYSQGELDAYDGGGYGQDVPYYDDPNTWPSAGDYFG